MGVTSKEAVLRLSVISKVEVTRSQHGLVWISDLESTLEELDPRVSKRFFKTNFLPFSKFRGNCVCILHSAISEGFVSVVHGRTFSVSFINKPQGFSCTFLPEHTLYQAEFWF